MKRAQPASKVEVVRTRSARNYSDRTLKILWGRAAGRCAVSTCRIDVLVDETEHDPIVVIGDIAHIESSGDLGPRANPGLTLKARDEYDNLILLCKNCHAQLDGQKNSNSVEFIKQLRADHEAWVRECLPERGRSIVGWQVVLLQGEQPIDQGLAVEALSPDYASGDILVIPVRSADEPWAEIYDQMITTVTRLFAGADQFVARYAVFPLAPVSACIALGHCLTSRPRVHAFQYHRDEQSWAWPKVSEPESDLTTAGLPHSQVTKSGEIALVFDISATVQDKDVDAVGDYLAKIRISTPRVGTGWLVAPSQLAEFGRVVRTAFESVLTLYPAATSWHLFYAGPAPGAIVLGQQINPTMSPPVQLYEFKRDSSPAYQPSILLGTSGSE